MKFAEGSMGRVFVLRLEEGEILHQEIERFADSKDLKRGIVLALGGADDGSRIVVGPEDGKAIKIEPMLWDLLGESEMAGVGTIFPDKDGKAVLHMHASFGREGRSSTGCVRAGVKVWLVQEIVIIEILGVDSARLPDRRSGFDILSP